MFTKIVANFGLGLLLSTTVLLGQQYRITTIAGGSPPPAPVAAAGVAIGNTFGIAVSPAGEVYFSARTCVFKIDRNGILSVYAGNSRSGFSGDGGPATNAELDYPQGLAFDPQGYLYIADSANNRIRMVSPSGRISTVAGSGIKGPFGDSGYAISAQLNFPQAVATDDSGNLYISDTFNNRIRKVTSDGTINTIAGTGLPGYAGEGIATNVPLNNPAGLKADNAGNVYVADYLNHRVRKISPNGTIATIAGTGVYGSAGLGGPPTSAQLFFPNDVALDSNGNIFISEAGQALEISGKIIGTVAGGGASWIDGVPATKSAALPDAIAVDSSGALYLADSGRIRKVSTAGIISTVTGDGTSFWGDGAPAIAAGLTVPSSVALGPGGELYIADSQNNRIRKVSVTGIISTVVGTGVQGFSGDGGPATQAKLCIGLLGAIAFDNGGNLYISDTCNQRIRKVSPTGIITTLAGNGTTGYSGDGGLATNASMNSPSVLALDSAGNIYFADIFNYRIRKISVSGVITLFAGNGIQSGGGDGGLAVNAPFSNLNGIAVDSANNVYIGDYGSLRKVNTAGIISEVLGNVPTDVIPEGVPASETPPTAQSVAIDAQGRIFFGGFHRIRRISTSGIVETIAGNSTAGYSGDGGRADAALLYSPSCLAVSTDGVVYACETNANAIRQLTPLPPQTIAFTALTDRTFGATPFSLSATASSGLAVTFTSTTTPICTVSGSTLTIVGAGSCSITASQAGDANYSSATAVTRSFTIIRASQTITFGPLKNVPVGTAPFTLIATATSGLPVAFAVPLFQSCTISGTTVTIFSEGICTITAAQPGNANYLAAASVTASLYVNGPVINTGGITPVYSLSTTIQPGSWISVYGTNLSKTTATWNGDFPQSLGGVSVSINGKAAYLWYVSSTQINLQAPDDATTGPVDFVLTSAGGVATTKVTLAPVGASFSLFDGKHVAAAILTPDGSGAYSNGGYDLVGPSGAFTFKTRPARQGETLIVFGVGFGPTNPPVAAGQVFSGSAPTAAPITITIGGVPATVSYSGTTAAGLYQFNVVVPATASGDMVLSAIGNGANVSGPVVTVE